MTAKIIRRRREPAGSIIEAAYTPSRFFCPEAANEDRRPVSLGLSPEEAEVIARLAIGKRTAAVANLLEIDEAAVKEHIKTVLRKLRTRPAPSPPDNSKSK
jgi:DNA-binding CsgD family transcriptional regulator